MSQVKTERKTLQLEKAEKENSESNCYRMDINIINFYDIFDIWEKTTTHIGTAPYCTVRQ